jgi:hypothetical protein
LYEGYKFNLQGRGSLGFAKVTAKDLDRNLTSITAYEQSYPYIGQVAWTEVRQTSTNRLLSKPDPSYLHYNPASYPGDPGSTEPKFVVMNQEVVDAYDLNDGSHLSSALTLNTSDNYGNLKVVDVRITDKKDSNKEHKTVTTTSYITPPDLTNWLIGRPSQVTIQ